MWCNNRLPSSNRATDRSGPKEEEEYGDWRAIKTVMKYPVDVQNNAYRYNLKELSLLIN